LFALPIFIDSLFILH